MTVYVIVQLRFTDRESYNRYQRRFLEIFRKFDGRLLAADEKPCVLEGRWDHDKLVMLQFPDEPASRQFLESPEYRQISGDRRRGADAIVLRVAGLPHGF